MTTKLSDLQVAVRRLDSNADEPSTVGEALEMLGCIVQDGWACDVCNGPIHILGLLGSITVGRCRDCGSVQSV